MLQFQYEEDLLHNCAEYYKNTRISTTTHNPASLSWGNKSENDSNCTLLFSQHQAYYNRSSRHTQNEERYATFLENVAFIHGHNHLEGETHRVALNHYSDRLDEELALAEFPSISDKIKDWTIHEKTQSYLQHYFDSFQSGEFVKRTQKKHQLKLQLLSLKKESIEMFREHYPDFQMSGDNWTTHLNWASTDNPDGLNLVHPVFDQVSHL